MTRARELAKVSTAYETGGAFGHRNKIINGAMVIAQRGTSFSVTGNTSNYPTDRWQFSIGNGTGVATVSQSTDAPANSNFVNSSLVTVTTAQASLSTSSFYQIQQRIEGYNLADLKIGTANAATVTISFWVKGSVTGTYSLAINREGASSYRSYVTTYTINSANTWEYKTITLVLDTSVTPTTAEQTTGAGLYVGFQLGTGSVYSTSTLNTWQSAVYVSSTSQVNMFATNGATFQITGVQLEAGRVATPFEMRSYGTELALCQRYCAVLDSSTYSDNYGRFGILAVAESSSSATSMYQYPVTMRATPTFLSSGSFALYNGGFVGVSSMSSPSGGVNMLCVVYIATGLTAGASYQPIANNNKTAKQIFSAEL